jgi:hypothetical protein
MKQEIRFQRFEGAAILIAALYFYGHFNLNWLWFVLLLFSVDVFMLGYLAGNRTGAFVYNYGHSLVIPPVLLIAGSLKSSNVLIALGLIWFAHIGLDRMLGFGLKLESGFKDTNLGKLGPDGNK